MHKLNLYSSTQTTTEPERKDEEQIHIVVKAPWWKMVVRSAHSVT